VSVYGLPRRGPAPDGVSDAALKHHVVGEKRVQEGFGVIGPCGGAEKSKPGGQPQQRQGAAGECVGAKHHWIRVTFQR